MTAPPVSAADAPKFGPGFRAELDHLMQWRRDLRGFRPDPVPAEALATGLRAFALAPPVGLSEPWRLVRLDSAAARAAALTNFESANAQALAGYSGDKAADYARLKLSGMRDAPVQLAVFCDESTAKGAGLGARTMPQMRAYSCVAAIAGFWLSLRAQGLGLGWVSILDPAALGREMNVPDCWHLIAYLCIGWPETSDDRPELERLAWEDRKGLLNMELR